MVQRSKPQSNSRRRRHHHTIAVIVPINNIDRSSYPRSPCQNGRTTSPPGPRPADSRLLQSIVLKKIHIHPTHVCTLKSSATHSDSSITKAKYAWSTVTSPAQAFRVSDQTTISRASVKLCTVCTSFRPRTDRANSMTATGLHPQA
jgi:hypothetical protein